jgi:hypothetical protein
MPSLETLQERRAKIDAKIQAIKAREAKKNRSRDTRKKIVLGGAVLKLAESGKLKLDSIVEQLSPRDRKLFGETPNEDTLQAIADAGKAEPLEFNAAVEKLKALEATA